MAIIVTAVGRLGKDAEVKRLTNGVVTAFSVATDAGYGQNKQTIWFDCGMFGEDGTRIATYLTKGKQVLVTGEFSEREYNGKFYKKLKVTSLSFISSGRSNDGGDNGGSNSYEAPAPSAPKPTAPAPQPQQEEREEDLPF